NAWPIEPDSLWVAFQKAEEPVVGAIRWTIDADLEEACHVVVHRLPVPTAAVRRRRRSGDGFEHGHHARSDLVGHRVEEGEAWNRLGGIIIPVAPKELDAPPLAWACHCPMVERQLTEASIGPPSGLEVVGAKPCRTKSVVVSEACVARFARPARFGASTS